jgi:hypothetical protein
VLEVFDRGGKLVRRFRSDDKPEPVDEKEFPIPTYWIRPARILSAKSGMQRFVWDLHYPEPKSRSHEYPISAIYMDTPRYPLGPSVLPGQYTLKLTAAGRTYTRTLDVAIDPRLKTTRAGLEQQLALSQQTVEGMNATFDALEALGKLRAQLKDLRARTGLAPALAESLAALDAKADALGNGAGNSAPAQTNLSQLHSRLSSLLEVLQQSDDAPTTQAAAASGEFQRQLRELMSSWQKLKGNDFEAVNAQLRAANLPTLTP